MPAFGDMEVKSMVLLLLAVVSMCSAQKCCFPDQYEILESKTIGSVVLGQGAIAYQITHFAFDYTNNRTAGLVTVYNSMGPFESYRLIKDFKKALKYAVFESLGVCQKYELSGSLSHCVPSNSTYVGSYYYGDKKITTDYFAYYINDYQTVGNATLGVTRGDCIPFGSLFIGNQLEMPLLTSEGYSNYTKGIKDPSKYFTVPSYCPKSFSEEARIENTLPGFSFF